MNIITELNKAIGGSTFNGKTGLLNKILEYRETKCIECKISFFMNRPKNLQIGVSKKLCNKCIKTRCQYIGRYEEVCCKTCNEYLDTGNHKYLICADDFYSTDYTAFCSKCFYNTKDHDKCRLYVDQLREYTEQLPENTKNVIEDIMEDIIDYIEYY